MTPDARGLVGLEAYSRDGQRIGKVEDVVRDPDSENADCLVIRYGAFRNLVVPVDAVQRTNGGVTVPISDSFLDGASGGRREAV
jgi:sporulation protein YlmC with PRC-barrel domain